MEISIILRELRVNNNKRQIDIANYLSMSKNGYASWEQGLAEPNIVALIKLSNLYNVSVDFLVGIEKLDFSKNTAIMVEQNNEPSQNMATLTPHEMDIIKMYRSLGAQFTARIDGYITAMYESNVNTNEMKNAK